ncbi:hypothetical protein BSBH6_03714 [Bacillus subtilis]|nr:hypothetical protein BSBH6_03714 [Bacillus subtilis]RPK20684.1 hypothetical protein BH5_03901 [Bacillus subtilis]
MAVWQEENQRIIEKRVMNFITLFFRHVNEKTGQTIKRRI